MEYYKNSTLFIKIVLGVVILIAIFATLAQNTNAPTNPESELIEQILLQQSKQNSVTQEGKNGDGIQEPVEINYKDAEQYNPQEETMQNNSGPEAQTIQEDTTRMQEQEQAAPIQYSETQENYNSPDVQN